MRFKRLSGAAMAATALTGILAGASPASATQATSAGNDPARLWEVTVEITNLAPDQGTNQTPVWVAVHDGSFDLYDRNVAISPELERLAEDGNNGPLIDAFAQSGAGIDAVVPGPNGPIAPGETTSLTFLVDSFRGEQQYFSYASMILPSNDAFVANGSPTAHRIFNNSGSFVPTSFVVSGGEVLDAGSEVNDEDPTNTAFFGQQTPDTGVVENGVVTLHPGFNDPADGGILAAPQFANGDFTQDGYETLKFEISAERVSSLFTTPLTGDNQVPAADTAASGRAGVRLGADGVIDWGVQARKIDNVLFAHIHLGGEDENGPVAVVLFNGDPSVGGFLQTTGQITDADLVGPLEGMTTLDLWEEIADGNAYINIHSSDFPAGELRANLG